MAQSTAGGRLHYVAEGTGRTTGAVAAVLVINPSPQALRTVVGNCFIPGVKGHQGYLIPGDYPVEVPAFGVVEILLEGYCTDIGKPAAPEGETLAGADQWASWQQSDPLPTPGWRPGTASGFYPAPLPDGSRAPEISFPGTLAPFPYRIDFNRHPRAASRLLLHALYAISTAVDQLARQGRLPAAPAGRAPDQFRRELIQQALWTYTAALEGKKYDQAGWAAQLQEVALQSHQATVAAPATAQELADKAADLWSGLELVGAEAKIIPVRAAEPAETFREQASELGAIVPVESLPSLVRALDPVQARTPQQLLPLGLYLSGQGAAVFPPDTLGRWQLALQQTWQTYLENTLAQTDPAAPQALAALLRLNAWLERPFSENLDPALRLRLRAGIAEKTERWAGLLAGALDGPDRLENARRLQTCTRQHWYSALLRTALRAEIDLRLEKLLDPARKAAVLGPAQFEWSKVPFSGPGWKTEPPVRIATDRPGKFPWWIPAVGLPVAGGLTYLLLRKKDAAAPPVANPDFLTIPCPGSSTVAVLANDSGTGIQITAVGAAPAGSTIANTGQALDIGVLNANSFSVNYTITDASGRTATAVVSVTVVDAEPPVLVCPPGVSVSFGQQNNLALTGQATATDACAGVVAPVFTDNNSGVTACTGAIIRSWTATDPGGNTASCQQTIVVADTEPPVFSLCPPAVTVACGQQNDLNLTGQAQATDNCSTPTLAFADTAPAPAGCSTTILRQWTAADPGGNSAVCEQIITLVDEQAPVITLCPPAVTVACGQHLNLAVTGLPQAADACNGVLPPVFSDNNSGFNGCSGTILRTWTVRDSCANTASCLQTLSVFDNAPPVISCPPPVTVTCGQQTVAAFTGAATASDACTANPVLNFTDDNSQFSACTGFITRTWRAIDQCGNTSTCTQTVTVLEAPCAFSAAFSTTAASCLGDCTGSAHTQVLPPGAYTYVWENGETGPNPTGLCPGPVSVSITDVQNFCTQVFTIDVPVAPPPTLLLVGAQPPSSPTSNDGRLALQIQAVAPDPPYQVFVNGNSIGFVPGPGFTINNLPAGFYQLWVVDGGGSGCLSNVVEVELFPQEGRPAPGVPELRIWMPQAPGGLLSRALEERLLSQQAPEMPGAAAYHWPSAVGIRWSQVLGAGREVYVETARQSGWRRPGAGWASPVIAQQFGFGLRQFVPAGRRLAVFREIGVGAAQLRSETAALHSWQLPVGGGFRWAAQAGWGLELEARCRLEWAPAIKTSAAVFEIRLSAFFHPAGRKSAPVLEAAPASYFQTEN